MSGKEAVATTDTNPRAPGPRAPAPNNQGSLRVALTDYDTRPGGATAVYVARVPTVSTEVRLLAWGELACTITQSEVPLSGHWLGLELRAAARACISSSAPFHCPGAAQRKSGRFSSSRHEISARGG